MGSTYLGTRFIYLKVAIKKASHWFNCLESHMFQQNHNTKPNYRGQVEKVDINEDTTGEDNNDQGMEIFSGGCIGFD